MPVRVFVNLTNYFVKCTLYPMSAAVALLEQPETVRLALSPMRRRLLRRLQTPASATELAGEMALARQKINYHLRTLEGAGLLSLVETRRKRGCTERVVVASARAFIVDPSLVGDRTAPADRTAAQDRFAASCLVAAASGLVRDVTRMQTRAERQRKRLLTFTIETEVGFAAPGGRRALLHGARRVRRPPRHAIHVEGLGAAVSRHHRRPPEAAPITARPRSRIMTESRAVVVEVVVAAPIDAVWKALRDPAAIAQWFGWSDPGLPEEIEYIFFTHATADDASYRLTMDKDEFTLEAQGDHTLVRVTRAAPAGGSWNEIYDDIAEGWRTFVHQLRFAFARHAWRSPDARSTCPAAPAAKVRHRLPRRWVSARFAEAWPGHLYAIDVATGDRLMGHVWFRSAWQIGLVVDAFGPGLLVAMRRPPTTTSPFGGGMFVLTLYGFDEAAHEALGARWRNWFAAAFDNVTVQT